MGSRRPAFVVTSLVVAATTFVAFSVRSAPTPTPTASRPGLTTTIDATGQVTADPAPGSTPATTTPGRSASTVNPVGAPGPGSIVNDPVASAIPPVHLTKAATAPIANQLVLGATLTQNSYDSGQDSAQDAAGRQILSQAVTMQAQHLMGWGALSPSVSPGTYDWSTLDRRVNEMTTDGALPVLVLCCSPDWMKGGQAGQTDWSQIEVAPTKQHFADFAALAAAAAARYTNIRYFVVWNELKGFFDATTNDWNVGDYIDLFNQTAAAIRTARPDALIGGPYVVVNSVSPVANSTVELSGSWGRADRRDLRVLQTFLANTEPDFVVVDANTTPNDVDTLTTDPFTANGKFGAVTRWLRTQTQLPVWWMEYYPQPKNIRWSESLQAAVHADALLEMAAAGAAAAFFWTPAYDGSGRASLTGDADKDAEGVATATGLAFARLKNLLTNGTPVVALGSDSLTVRGWKVGNEIVIVNEGNHVATVTLPDGTTMKSAQPGVTTVG